MPQLLAVGPTSKLAIGNAVRVLAWELANTDEWRRFLHLSNSLDTETISTLKSLRRHISGLLTDQAVNAYEPNDLLRQLEYRYDGFARETDRLEGSANDYTDAFTAVHDLIDTVVSKVFGQLVCYGPPKVIGPITELEFLPGSGTVLRFSPPVSVWLRPGQLVKAQDDLVTDALLIAGTRFTFDLESGHRTLATARRLLQSTSVLGSDGPSTVHQSLC